MKKEVGTQTEDPYLTLQRGGSGDTSKPIWGYGGECPPEKNPDNLRPEAQVA